MQQELSRAQSGAGIYRRLERFFNLRDPKYTAFLKKHEAADVKQIAFYLMLAVVPGFIAYFLVFHMREPISRLTGWSDHYTQFVILALMASGWHTFFPFFMLRWKDKLTFKQSLHYLGFTRLDLRGLILIVPIITLLFTAVSLPYMKYIYPPLHDFLNGIPMLRMEGWHIYNQGYYDFPWFLLLIGIFGNFVGEEIYFRGYLLRKLGKLKYDWLIVSVCFQLYHMWQAPVNWSFLLLAVVIPCEIIVRLRKSIYGAIVFHIFVNVFWGEITRALVGV
ncbi:CPBP family intramembrane glutamic endopeptidase [Paenibacillus tuaregi]|uniref:CPBP family intramembrane glutamic endopeptidase n=1 Tax=Paenibacillus tuaregi TaxID=1816681 RepID=UPI0008398DF5|nr:CPBP family intramembrane glutamic endopeptidase [Paenibacillus tuaregi]